MFVGKSKHSCGSAFQLDLKSAGPFDPNFVRVASDVEYFVILPSTLKLKWCQWDIRTDSIVMDLLFSCKKNGYDRNDHLKVEYLKQNSDS